MLSEDETTGADRLCETGVSPSTNRHYTGLEEKDMDTGVTLDTGVSHPQGS